MHFSYGCMPNDIVFIYLNISKESLRTVFILGERCPNVSVFCFEIQMNAASHQSFSSLLYDSKRLILFLWKHANDMPKNIIKKKNNNNNSNRTQFIWWMYDYWTNKKKKRNHQISCLSDFPLLGQLCAGYFFFLFLSLSFVDCLPSIVFFLLLHFSPYVGRTEQTKELMRKG